MSIREGVTIDEIGRVSQSLEDLLARCVDMTPVMSAIADYGHASTTERFEMAQGPDGQSWKPSHRARFEGGQTLVDSGHLRNEIVSSSSPDHAEWGSNTPYALIHQFGGTIRAKKASHLHFNIPGIGFRSPMEVVMPARPFLGINDEDEREIGAIVQHYIAEALDR